MRMLLAAARGGSSALDWRGVRAHAHDNAQRAHHCVHNCLTLPLHVGRAQVLLLSSLPAELRQDAQLSSAGEFFCVCCVLFCCVVLC